MEHRNPQSRDFLNRRRWSIAQKKQLLASLPAHDYEAERTQKVTELRTLADALETLPHMAPTLAGVRAEIDRLSR